VSLVGVVLAVAFVFVFKYTRTENRSVITDKQETSQQRGTVKPSETAPTQPASNSSGVSSTAENNASKASNTSLPQTAKSSQQPAVSEPSTDTQNSARVSAQEKRPDTSTPESHVEREANTRSVGTLPSALSLSAVKQIYVEIGGDEAPAKNLREMVAERLRASNRIILAPNRDGADGLLKVIAIKGVGTEADRADVELINARGNVIWPNSRSPRKYHGSPAGMSANIVRDILLAMQRSAKGR
jgi:hypothetical protein